jgi:hypothetical protein
MKHRGLVLLIGVMTAAGSVGCVVKAVQRFRQPFPAWMVEADQWYDAALGAAANAVIAGACFVHLYRNGRRDPALAAAPTRWADRVELRTAVYAFVGFLALQLPLGVVKTVRAVNNPAGPPWGRTFWSLFPKMMVVGPVLAVVIIYYDRRRLRLEAREEAGSCRVCGYDLRATPERCPECGAMPEVRA